MKNKHGGGNVSNSIYYKGKKYGGGEAAKPQEIQAEENELLVGDGKKWTKSSPILAVKKVLTTGIESFNAYTVGA